MPQPPRLEPVQTIARAAETRADSRRRSDQEVTIRRLRLGVVLALGDGLGIAFADGRANNNAGVDGSISPTKLDKKKYKPVALFSGVRTSVPVGRPARRRSRTSEYISYRKNVKFDFKAGSVCTTLPPSGSTPEQARAACPADSYLGSGAARSRARRLLRSPTSSSRCSAGRRRTGSSCTPTARRSGGRTDGARLDRQVECRQGVRPGALGAERAADRRVGMITKFNATISKSSKAVTARCKTKTMKFLGTGRSPTWTARPKLPRRARSASRRRRRRSTTTSSSSTAELR